MPDKKQKAWDAAKKIRDAEFDQRDKEIKKWDFLYAEYKKAIAINDKAGASALSDELSKQSQVVSRCFAMISGKIKAMGALQDAKTLKAADDAIDKLVREEIDELFAILAGMFPGVLEGIFKKKFAPVGKNQNAFEKAYLILLEIKGKQEIESIVDAA